jgi:hypothetical protein
MNTNAPDPDPREERNKNENKMHLARASPGREESHPQRHPAIIYYNLTGGMAELRESNLHIPLGTVICGTTIKNLEENAFISSKNKAVLLLNSTRPICKRDGWQAGTGCKSRWRDADPFLRTNRPHARLPPSRAVPCHNPFCTGSLAPASGASQRTKRAGKISRDVIVAEDMCWETSQANNRMNMYGRAEELNMRTGKLESRNFTTCLAC